MLLTTLREIQKLNFPERRFRGMPPFTHAPRNDNVLYRSQRGLAGEKGCWVELCTSVGRSTRSNGWVTKARFRIPLLWLARKSFSMRDLACYHQARSEILGNM